MYICDIMETFEKRNQAKYNAKNIADWILTFINTEAGDTISPLKLQKLIYYCQAWHYTVFNEPLFDEQIEAWALGPVVPSQYKRFAGISRECSISVSQLTDVELKEFDSPTLKLLTDVMNVYGEHSALYLMNLTHSEPPWKKARNGLDDYKASSKPITLEDMKEYYSTLRKSRD